MGWASCGTNPDTGDEMGYAHEGMCAEDGCDKEINHGLAYVCGDMHQGGEHGCGRYFCYEHLYAAPQLCSECWNAWDALQEERKPK